MSARIQSRRAGGTLRARAAGEPDLRVSRVATLAQADAGRVQLSRQLRATASSCRPPAPRRCWSRPADAAALPGGGADRSQSLSGLRAHCDSSCTRERAAAGGHSSERRRDRRGARIAGTRQRRAACRHRGRASRSASGLQSVPAASCSAARAIGADSRLMARVTLYAGVTHRPALHAARRSGDRRRRLRLRAGRAGPG